MGRGDDIKKIINLAIKMRTSIGGYSIKDIQDITGDKLRTAWRNKKIIEDVFGLEEVENSESKEKRWRLTRGTLDTISAFTPDEIAVLKDCMEYMKGQNYIGKYDLLDAILDKMMFKSGNLIATENDVEDLLKLQGYAIRQTPAIKINNDIMKTISEAMLAQKYLFFMYKNKKGEEKLRKVAPYGIIYGEYTYLIGKGEKEKFVKYFLLHKIKKLQPTSQYFEKDEDFDLKKYLSRSFGIYQDIDTMKVKLLFSPNVKDEILNYQLHPTQQITNNPDGTTTVTFEAGGAYEICWYLFRMGEDVKILEPQSLKDTYKELIEKAQKQIL